MDVSAFELRQTFRRLKHRGSTAIAVAMLALGFIGPISVHEWVLNGEASS